ncbi:uncharacterized protein LOC128614599 [Ictalurus furcatus]|uniref:uncharacterized protein LOC128614599 n=1 Tax=Ictalurus furcatus TaxID=66913 RepID=UPI00235009D5|nr:uncharacterized protein LOC128614599 [Ictalurus furcatus]XP_053492015.1 uncharacterized protein LOC128614599 [Ictalurus furcatus]
MDVKQKLDQMLHSILFLCYIHSSYRAEVIFAQMEILNRTKTYFPIPFEQYQTHVALQKPFSFLLELVTKCYGQYDEFIVKDMLSEILDGCKKSGVLFPLISTVICVCKNVWSRYYGASLSCESVPQRELMTAVSCVNVWHPKVSSSVMSVFPDGDGEPHRIEHPDRVKCRAYAIEGLRQLKPPCETCNKLYSLPGHTQSKSPW